MEYKIVHFRDKWYICHDDEMIDIAYASKEYAEKCLKTLYEVEKIRGVEKGNK